MGERGRGQGDWLPEEPVGDRRASPSGASWDAFDMAGSSGEKIRRRARKEAQGVDRVQKDKQVGVE